MAGWIERVAPGSPAEEALAAAVVSIQARDRLTPVFVVVGSPLVGLSLRQQLARRGAYACVRFGTFARLVDVVAASAPHLDARARLGAVALRSAARVALSEAPGVMAPVAGHTATEASLATTYRNLRNAHAGELAMLGASSGRAGDVIALVERMRELLSPSYRDVVDDLAAAIGTAESGPLEEPAAVVLYLPEPLGEVETRLVETLASRGLPVAVLAGRTGDVAGDRSVDAYVEGLRDRGFEVRAASTRDEAAPARFAAFVSAPDDEVEVREAVRALMAHAEAGGDLARCVIAYPDGEATAHLGRRIASQLRAAEVPCHGEPTRPLADSAEGRLLRGLLGLARPAEQGFELDRREVIAWLGSGPIRIGGGLTHDLGTVSGMGVGPVGLWDRCSRAAGVLAGLGQWRHRLAAYAGGQMGHLRGGTTAEATTDLLTFVDRLHVLLSGGARETTWVGFAAWLVEAMHEILEPSARREDLEAAVAELAALDDLEPVGALDPASRFGRFATTLDVALEHRADDRGRFGVGPTVGSLSDVAGLSSDLLLVLGCREGALPGPQAADPLLPDAETVVVAGLRRERPEARQRRQVSYLVGASQVAQASYSRIDVAAGRGVYASRWVEGDLFTGLTTEIPSFAASLRRPTPTGGALADLTDLELATISRDGRRRGPSVIEQVDLDYRRRMEAGRSRGRNGLNRFAGHVGAAVDGAAVWARPQSATTLQNFAVCPFQFFVDKILGVDVLEAPEQLMLIDARDRGTLFHDVLEGFFGMFVASGVEPEFDALQKNRLQVLADAQFEIVEAAGKTGKPIFWQIERRTISKDLQRFVEKDVAASTEAGLVPVAVELDFGRETAPVVIHAAGNDVSFRGRIDRIDRDRDGDLVVTDYKSGKSEGYKEMQVRPLARGRRLQLPIYAKAALQELGEAVRVRAEYRFVQSTADYAVIPVVLTEEVDAELSDTLGILVSTIASGCFPPRPGALNFRGTWDNCRWCDFDSICTIDRPRLWNRAITDQRMWKYASLVDPPETVGAADATN